MSIGADAVKLTLAEVAAATKGTLIGGDPHRIVTEVFIDSRQQAPPDALFIALEGPHFDGHDFIAQACKKGAVAALVHGDIEDPAAGPLIRVDDTQKALQSLAATWRARFSIPVVGITGSNGKTIVKDMLAAILGRTRTVYRSPGSFNSQIGVPLAVLGLREEHELAIIEAGISRPFEMEALEEVVRPTDGIITNIGLAHAAGLGDLETTAREKKKLFARTAGVVVVPAAETTLSEDLFHVKRHTIAWEVEDSDAPFCKDSVCIKEVRTEGDGFAFELSWKSGRTLEIHLDVPGRHNVENAAAAAAMAAHLGADDASIAEGLAAYSLCEMRLEMHTTGSDITLINDAYNADPISVRAALGVLDDFAGRQRKIAILGDMLDLGSRAEEAHRDVGQRVAARGIDGLFCVGPLAKSIGQGALEAGMASENVECLDDFDELHLRLEESLRPGDVVLFKASRSIGLDRAARRLIESVAPTRLFIDLEAISHNFHALRRHLGSKTKVMAVVKSFGYGNDATRISQTLIQQGVDQLAVAFPDEAIPLRRRGLTLPILVTNVRAAEADKFIKYDLDALVYTRQVAQALSRQARHRNKRVAVHIEVDTGMHRAGLKPRELPDFAAWIEEQPALDIAAVMTHFASADDGGDDDFTAYQLEQFTGAIEELRKRGIDPPLIHAANTAAAWRFPQARFDMVRVGLGLYGLHPSSAVEECVEERAASMRPALRFTTRVLYIHTVSRGDTVGYGRTWTAPGPRILATLAAGYNDGFPRFLSNRGRVLINGNFCPVVGSICMDVAVVDITDAGHVDVGDEAVLFGTQDQAVINVDEWAALGNTINYELLCNISPRVRRIFLK